MSAVSAANAAYAAKLVAKVRAVTGDRLRAWTDAELMKIISEQKEPR